MKLLNISLPVFVSYSKIVLCFVVIKYIRSYKLIKLHDKVENVLAESMRVTSVHNAGRICYIQ